jgi:hypothetical protein
MRRGRPDLDHAVQVCEHIANEGKPVLWGRRNEADGSEDSGWQFRCTGDSVEPPTGFRFWSIHELIEEDPSVSMIINCPLGATVERSQPEEDWVVTGYDPRKPVR